MNEQARVTAAGRASALLTGGLEKQCARNEVEATEVDEIT